MRLRGLVPCAHCAGKKNNVWVSPRILLLGLNFIWSDFQLIEFIEVQVSPERGAPLIRTDHQRPAQPRVAEQLARGKLR
jgi:hypothetical protein